VRYRNLDLERKRGGGRSGGEGEGEGEGEGGWVRSDLRESTVEIEGKYAGDSGKD
jgi:hypothetical protein